MALQSSEPDLRRAPLKQRVWTAEAQPDGTIKRSEVEVEVPPNAPPEWVEKIYERLFEKILPPKKGMSVEFYDAAIYGYALSAIQRERTARLEACKSLPPKSEQRQVHEELARTYEPTLDACRRRVTEVLADWKLPEAADYLKGFAYGIERQHREEGWIPAAATETLLIYKTLLRQRRTVENLIRQNATARQIGELITQHATKSGGMTYAEYFQKHPNSEHRETFLKTAQKIFERLGIPLPPRGRPRRNSDTK